MRLRMRNACRLALGLGAAILRATAAAPGHTAGITSPIIQDALTNPPLSSCSAARSDGQPTYSFSWTHTPVCASVSAPPSRLQGASIDSPSNEEPLQFCVYTNSAFHSNRGISILTTPLLASQLSSSIFFFPSGSEAFPAPWIVKSTPTAGYGLFASPDQRLQAGSTILRKSSVLFLNKDAMTMLSLEDRRMLLDAAVERLPRGTRDAVGKLSSRGGEAELEDIVSTNTHRVAAWDLEGTPHLALNPEAARVNHACRPNAFYRFHQASLDFEVFAIRDIEPGDEVTISYGFATAPLADRVAALQTHWSFPCNCPLCTANTSVTAASDARLSRISTLRSTLFAASSDLPKLARMLVELISLLDDEGLVTEMPRFEEILAYTWSQLGQEEKARMRARRARERWAIVAGRESWEVKRMRGLEEGVRAHPTWRSWKGRAWEEEEDGEVVS